MKIEKITRLKNGKYKLLFENGEVLNTYDDVILNNKLLFKKEIDDEIFLKIKEESNYFELYNLAVKYIMKRLRSEKEIYMYLEKRTKDSYVIDSIIIDLKKLNLINDRKFAHAYINDKLYLSNSGMTKIKADLTNLGVNKDIIEEESTKFNSQLDICKLEKMIIKRININHRYSNSMLKQKIINEMVNLGYSKEDIINIIDKNMKDDNELYKCEYNKLYNKLKKKYSGSELEYMVKQKMYMKGFFK